MKFNWNIALSVLLLCMFSTLYSLVILALEKYLGNFKLVPTAAILTAILVLHFGFTVKGK